MHGIAVEYDNESNTALAPVSVALNTIFPTLFFGEILPQTQFPINIVNL